MARGKGSWGMPKGKIQHIETIQKSEREKAIENRLRRYRALKGEEPRNAFLLSKTGLQLIQDMARENFSDVKIAFVLENPNIIKFREQNPMFDLSWKYGQDLRINDVENAMFISAKGYKSEEHFSETKTGPDGTQIVFNQVRERSFPPDPRAQQYILNNLRPATYKAQQEVSSNLPFSGIKVVMVVDDGSEPKAE